MSFTIIDLAVLAGEVAVLAIVFYLLWWILLQTLFKRLRGLPGSRTRSLVTVLQKRLFQLLVLLWAVCSLFIIGVNVILLSQGKELLPVTQEYLNLLPLDFWLGLSRGLVPSALVIGVAAFIQRPLDVFLKKASQQVQNWDQYTENDASIDQFFRALKVHLRDSIGIGALFLCSGFFQLTLISGYLFIGLKIYLAIAAGSLVLKISDAIIDSLDAMVETYIYEIPALQAYSKVRRLVPFLKRCLEYAIYIGVATLAFAQITPLVGLADLGTRAIRILGILLASRMLIEISSIFIYEFLVGNKDLSPTQSKRRLTLVPIIQSILKYGVFFGAGILILTVLSIDPGPILAAAGIVGFAVGLGAQNLINDTVSGFFILIENYYLVGDYIETGDAEGIVESIELRTTRIRHPNGQLQILRNGDIVSITNFSRDYIYAVVDVGVAYDSDLNHVYRVIEAVGVELQNMFPQDVLEPTEVDGVEAFEASRLIVRSVTRLKPNDSRRGVHDDVQGELRKLLKEAFDRAGIIIPVINILGMMAAGEGKSSSSRMKQAKQSQLSSNQLPKRRGILRRIGSGPESQEPNNEIKHETRNETNGVTRVSPELIEREPVDVQESANLASKDDRERVSSVPEQSQSTHPEQSQSTHPEQPQSTHPEQPQSTHPEQSPEQFQPTSTSSPSSESSTLEVRHSRPRNPALRKAERRLAERRRAEQQKAGRTDKGGSMGTLWKLVRGKSKSSDEDDR